VKVLVIEKCSCLTCLQTLEEVEIGWSTDKPSWLTYSQTLYEGELANKL
jgi:hypothetical protein